MSSLCLCFQIHQPPRLRHYNVFDAGHDYFNHNLNRDIIHRISRNCYIPALGRLLKAVRRYKGRFCFALSITGCTLEQLQRHYPETILLLKALAQTGCVEFLSETYYHSLSSVFCESEFHAQVKMHAATIEQLFHQSPTVFRNTELVYCDHLAKILARHHPFRGILLEGVDHVLQGRPSGCLYASAAAPDIKLMTRHYELSDDLAFRFANPNGASPSLTAGNYARKIKEQTRHCDLANVFLDFETFGEHHRQETGILRFLEQLPAKILSIKGLDFITPSQAIRQLPVTAHLSVPDPISWADTQRDLSAWLGNRMQKAAMQSLYDLHPHLNHAQEASLLHTWRQLSCSDHFYYMSTKCYADGQVHAYFSPFDSPYDAYINFMNVLDHFKGRIAASVPSLNTTPIAPQAIIPEMPSALSAPIAKPASIA